MKKLLSILLVIICLTSNINIVVKASNSDTDLDPNIYEKKEIQIKQKNKDKNIQTKELPIEQKSLSFEIIEQSSERQLVNDLFQSGRTENNTIITMSSDLYLFSDTESRSNDEFELEESSQNLNILQYLMVSFVVIAIIILFVIFPRLIKE